MLEITILGKKYFDESKDEIVYPEARTLQLEHSLVSLSKWEEEFEKPFLDKGEKTDEEILGYIMCMNLTPNTPPEVFQSLSKENLEAINAYINAKKTATWFKEVAQGQSPPNREVITAELVYYWMISVQMPIEPFQHWHLNRLFTLLRVFAVKNGNQKNKKLTREERSNWLSERAALNEARKKQLGHDG